MVKSVHISLVGKFFTLLLAASMLLIPTGYTPNQDPEQDTQQIYLPLVQVAPPETYQQVLNTLGGSDGLFYVSGGLAFLGHGYQLVILDVSEPDYPTFLTEIQLPARLTSLIVQDSYGYLTLGDAGIAILDLGVPSQAYILSQLPLAGSSRHVLLSGNVAFVSGTQALYVLDISQPAHPYLLSSIPMFAYYSQFHDGLLLVVHGGFTFFDISDLSAPVKVGSYEDVNMDSVSAIGPDHIFMTGVSGCGMHGCAYFISVIDVRDPARPVQSDYLDTQDTPSILIDGNDIYFTDLNQIIFARINSAGVLEKLAYHTPEVAFGFLRLERDKMYLGGYSSIEILDVRDPFDIEQVGKYTNPSYEFEASQISLPYIYYRARPIDAVDFSDRLLVLDVSDADEPELVSETPFSSLNVQPGFWASQIYLDGDRLYVTFPTGRYTVFFPIMGLKIFDLQQPIYPVLIADYLPGAPNNTGVWFEDSRYSVEIKDAIGYIVTMGKDLEIVDLNNPTSPLVLSTVPAEAKMVRLDGSHAYLISEVFEEPIPSLHLLTLDVANPRQPTILSDYVISSTFETFNYSFDVSGGIAYLGLPGILRLVDVSNPASPSELSVLPIDSQLNPANIEVQGDLAIIGIENRMEIIDVSTPLTPTQLAVFDADDFITTIQILDHYVYLTSLAGAHILDISYPDQPRELQSYPGYATSMVSKKGYPVYVARLRDGVEIYPPYPPVIPGE